MEVLEKRKATAKFSGKAGGAPKQAKP